MPLAPDDRQTQYLACEPAARDTTLEPVLQWIDAHLDYDLTLAEIAVQARTTERTLTRRFKQQLGTTPHEWILRARVRRARALLDSADHTIEEIATRVGFQSAERLRRHFNRLVGMSPTTYRHAGEGSHLTRISAAPVVA